MISRRRIRSHAVIFRHRSWFAISHSHILYPSFKSDTIYAFRIILLSIRQLTLNILFYSTTPPEPLYYFTEHPFFWISFFTLDIRFISWPNPIRLDFQVPCPWRCHATGCQGQGSYFSPNGPIGSGLVLFNIFIFSLGGYLVMFSSVLVYGVRIGVLFCEEKYPGDDASHQGCLAWFSMLFCSIHNWIFVGGFAGY